MFQLNERTEPKDDAARALYVHLAHDGGIFIVNGATGASGWVTRAQLAEALQQVRAEHGSLLYSRDASDQEPPPYVSALFQWILSYELPIRLLREAHPTPRAHAQEDYTALMAAAYSGHSDMVADLIARHVPVDTRDAAGYTALMYAAKTGQEQIVAQLLEAGADPHARDKQGSRPLMFAAQHGYEGVVRLLLARGADPWARGDHGLTAIDLARQHGQWSTVSLLTR